MCLTCFWKLLDGHGINLRLDELPLSLFTHTHTHTCTAHSDYSRGQQVLAINRRRAS